jgi:RNA polymerase sigma-70 factor (ECF subfamily)
MVFELKVFQEMSIPEIAAATGMAEGTVKSHLFRATQSVRGQLHRWTET